MPLIEAKIREHKLYIVNVSRKVFLIALAVIVSTQISVAQTELEIGAGAPKMDQKMEDYTGRTVTLSEAAQRNGLIVMFSCNTCPRVAQMESRYVDLSNFARSNQIGMIALNPNERARDRGESMDEMKKRANKMNYNFYYALDKDHIIADAFGATTTPQVFLFNSDMKLVYKGAIDDNPKSASGVKQNYLITAIEEVIGGKEVVKTSTKAVGCLIKRKQ